jgi:hypothetical protein
MFDIGSVLATTMLIFIDDAASPKRSTLIFSVTGLNVNEKDLQRIREHAPPWTLQNFGNPTFIQALDTQYLITENNMAKTLPYGKGIRMKLPTSADAIVIFGWRLPSLSQIMIANYSKMLELELCRGKLCLGYGFLMSVPPRLNHFVTNGNIEYCHFVLCQKHLEYFSARRDTVRLNIAILFSHLADLIYRKNNCFRFCRIKLMQSPCRI